MRDVLYWAWPSAGAGHEMRAAAICRRLAPRVQIIRGATVASDWAIANYRLPVARILDRRRAVEYLASRPDALVVVDDDPDPELSSIADVFVWKAGRRRIAGAPTIAVDGPDSFFPVIAPFAPELLSREAARRALGVADDWRVKLGVRSDSFPDLIGKTHRVDLILDQRPAVAYLPAADHLVACIGLNLYGEVRWLEEFHGLEVDQTWVAAPNRPDQLARLLDHDHPIHPDGAQAAADLITEMR